MRRFWERLVVTLCSGYVIVFFGEFVFWATPDREGMSFGGMLGVWLLYSVMAYPFLCVVSYFRVRDPWAVFLAGAFYGWFEEGLVVQTTYGSSDTPFPMSISFTALAWHAPLDIWIGWYLLRRLLTENHRWKIFAWASGVGLFYGLWAIFWWNEPPEPMKALLAAGRKDLVLLHFAGFAFGTTALLVLAYAVYQRVQIAEFRPSKVELGAFGVLTVLYFAFVTVPAAPKSLWLLPLLLGPTLWALFHNRRVETRTNVLVAFSGRVAPVNYLILFALPAVAVAVYFVALALDLRLPTNLAVYYVATPAGALLWLASLFVCVRRGWLDRRRWAK